MIIIMFFVSSETRIIMCYTMAIIMRQILQLTIRSHMSKKELSYYAVLLLYKPSASIIAYLIPLFSS